MPKNGYFWQGMAQGIPEGMNMVTNALQFREQKKAKDKLDAAQEKFKLDSSQWSLAVDKAFADGELTQEEITNMSSMSVLLGTEFSNEWKTLYKDYQNKTEKEIDDSLAALQGKYEMYTKSINPKSTESLVAVCDGILLNPKSDIRLKDQATYMKQLLVGNLENAPKAGAKSYEEATATYPGIEVKQGTDMLWYPTGKKIEENKNGYDTFEEADAARKGDNSIAVKSENGVYVLERNAVTPDKPNAPTEYDKKVSWIKNNLPPEKQKEAMEQLIGVAPKTSDIPTPTSVESIKTEIIDAPTPEDAQRVYNNSVQKYGTEVSASLGIADPKKEWIDDKKVYLENIYNLKIQPLVDKQGKIIAGKETLYLEAVTEYNKYMAILKESGVDVSTFPQLKTMEEYNTTDSKSPSWKPNTWGQQKSIYK